MGHLTDCIRDHGPVYTFWLYAFKRMNGVLGSFQTSNHNISVQLMHRFDSMQRVATFEEWPESFKLEIQPLFQSYYRESGSLLETMSTGNASNIKPLPPFREKSFNTDELKEIVQLMISIHNDEDL